MDADLNNSVLFLILMKGWKRNNSTNHVISIEDVVTGPQILLLK